MPDLYQKPATVQPQRGFTLLEIMAALAILALAMTAVLGGVTQHANHAGYLKEKTIALWIARNRMVETHLEQSWPKEGRSDGETAMAGSDWAWQMEVKATPDEDLRRVEIRIESPNDRGELIQLTGFIPREPLVGIQPRPLITQQGSDGLDSENPQPGNTTQTPGFLPTQ